MHLEITMLQVPILQQNINFMDLKHYTILELTIGTQDKYIHSKKKEKKKKHTYIYAIHPLKIDTANLIIRLHTPITIFRY